MTNPTIDAARAACAEIARNFSDCVPVGAFRVDNAHFLLRPELGGWAVNGGPGCLYPSRYFVARGVFATPDEANAAMIADESIGLLRVTDSGVCILAALSDTGRNF
jgi:hypothetical protein